MAYGSKQKQALVSGANPVAGATDGGLARGPGPVLVSGRARCEDRGRVRSRRGCLGRSGSGGSVTLAGVSPRLPSSVSGGYLTFAEREDRDLVCAAAQCPRDRPAAGPGSVDDLARVASQRLYADLPVGLQGLDRAVARRASRAPAKDLPSSSPTTGSATSRTACPVSSTPSTAR